MLIKAKIIIDLNRPSDVSKGNQTVVPLFLWLSFSCTCYYVLEGGGSEDNAQTLFFKYSVFSVSRLSPHSNPSSSVDTRLFSIISQGLFFPVRSENREVCLRSWSNRTIWDFRENSCFQKIPKRKGNKEKCNLLFLTLATYL